MTHKLLLADDSVTIQRVIELTFADEDVQVVAVGDGRQAIERIPAERPDIVLADVGMPERDGYEVASFIKREPSLAHIPVLLLTGAFEPVDEARARAAGCDGVLAKPFEPQMLIARVKELLSAARSPKAPPVPVPEAMPPQPASPRLAPVHQPRKPDPEPEPPAWSAAVMDQAAPARTPAPAAVDVQDAAASAAPAPPPNALDEYFDKLDAAFATLATSFESEAKPPEDRDWGSIEAAKASWQAADAAPARPQAGDVDWVLPGVCGDEDDGQAAGEPDLGTAASADRAMAFGAVTPPPARPLRNRPPVSFDALDRPSNAPGASALEPGPSAEPRPAGTVADAFEALLAIENGEPAIVPSFAPPVEIGDELVERISRRVLEQLSEQHVHATVADIVSRIAERLVREEIDRLRSGLA